MKKRLLLLTTLLAVTVTGAVSQQRDSVFNVPDTAQVLTIQELYESILKNHPVAKQAWLLSEVARQEIRLARGNFDPKLEAELQQKKYKGKEYYSIFNGNLSIPTIVPLNPSVGIDQNTGNYLNPERYTDPAYNNQQFYAGLSIPLGRGLITDERRTSLRQAEIFKEMTEAEQVAAINKLLLDATKLYWDWYYAYYNFRLLDNSATIADDIFQRVKNNFLFGEAAAIDTVMAHINRQQRSIEKQQALLDLTNAGVTLSAMLWDNDGHPVQLDLTWVPVLQPDTLVLTKQELNQLSDLAKANHPELKKMDGSIRQLEVEKKLAREVLKPTLNFNYYAINQPINPEGITPLSLNNNYKLGVDFSFPLFLRKERAKLALTQLKITNARLKLSQTEREIINNLTVTYNELVNLQSIIVSQREMITGFERLLAAELINLEQGESDLFRINLQQERLIQTQSKWLKSVAENEKYKAKLYWAAGTNRLGASN
jgi:outer membrane protein TolC